MGIASEAENVIVISLASKLFWSDPIGLEYQGQRKLNVQIDKLQTGYGLICSKMPIVLLIYDYTN